MLLSNIVSINNPISFISLASILKTIIFGNYGSLFNTNLYLPLWFLPAVFSLVVLRRSVLSITNEKNRYYLSLLLLLSSFLTVYLNNRYSFNKYIPYGFDVAIVCLPFITLIDLKDKIYKYSPLLIPILFSIIWIFKGDIGVGSLKIANYPIFFLTSTSGIVMVLILSQKLKMFSLGGSLATIGKYSLQIYLLHGIVFDFWRPLANRIPYLKNWDVLNFSSLFLGVLVPIFFYRRTVKQSRLAHIAFGQRSS